MNLNTTLTKRKVTVLNVDSSAILVSSSSTETIVYRYTVKGGSATPGSALGTMGGQGGLRLTWFGHVKNNSGGAATITIRVLTGTPGYTLSTDAGVKTGYISTSSSLINNANERAISGMFKMFNDSYLQQGLLGGTRIAVATTDTTSGVADQVGDDMFAHYHNFAQDTSIDFDLCVSIQLSVNNASTTFTGHIFVLELIPSLT